MGMFASGSVSGSINDINNEFYIANITLGEVSELRESIVGITQYIQNHNEIVQLMHQVKNCAVEWEGEAKLAYDDFVYFQEQYLKDMMKAIEGYKEAITIIEKKASDVMNANLLKEVQSI